MPNTAAILSYKEHQIEVFRDTYIYAREYDNNGPSIYLLHGFPDNIHLYDYLIPEIADKFHVIVFDFLGWHLSSQPAAYSYTAIDQLNELKTVIDYFKIKSFWLVAHDASGPPAINYALNHPDRINKLILLNTYYSRMKALRKPEAIWMFSTPLVRKTAGWVARNINFMNKLVFKLQVGKFMKNKERRKILVPKLYSPFSKPANFNAFLKLNADLDAAIKRNTGRVAELQKLTGKVKILFGAKDPYLNIAVAKNFKEIIPGSQLQIIPNAGHYVQVDQPEMIAKYLVDFE